MVKRASKRAGGAKKAGKAKPAQPMLPNFVALKTARHIMEAAGRITERPAPAVMGLVASPSRRDSRLPEAKLNAVAGARRREPSQASARRSPTGRKPLSRTPSRTGQSTAKASAARRGGRT
jgi:hypothetical protein